MAHFTLYGGAAHVVQPIDTARIKFTESTRCGGLRSDLPAEADRVRPRAVSSHQRRGLYQRIEFRVRKIIALRCRQLATAGGHAREASRGECKDFQMTRSDIVLREEHVGSGGAILCIPTAVLAM